MTDEKKPPPEDESSAFKSLLDKLAKVPKGEIDEEEYRREKANALGKKPA